MTFNVDAIPAAVGFVLLAAGAWLTRERFYAARERRRRTPGALQMHGDPRVFAGWGLVLAVAVLVVPFD